jgi:hypothetical protein
MGCCKAPATAQQRASLARARAMLPYGTAVDEGQAFVDGAILFFGRSSNGGFGQRKVDNPIIFQWGLTDTLSAICH